MMEKALAEWTAEKPPTTGQTMDSERRQRVSDRTIEDLSMAKK
jgi:hypothetical protein